VKRLRVLIADDHTPTRDDVRQILSADERFEVCAEAANAPAAVAAALGTVPDICLLDIRMPGSGVLAAWEITSRLPSTQVVMLTVSEDEEDLFAALRSGASGYLLKDSRDRRTAEHHLCDSPQPPCIGASETSSCGRVRGASSDHTPGYALSAARVWRDLHAVCAFVLSGAGERAPI
jgi:CheY-like chemotaxis protein